MLTGIIKKRGFRAAPCGGCCTRLFNFGVSFGENRILSNISLHVHCGELTAIIGPNGAGKTTLFRAILGEIPFTGELHFVRSDNSAFGRPRIGYVPQRLDVDMTSPISVLDLLASMNSKYPVCFGCGSKAREKAVEMLSLVEAENLVDKKLAQLSGGQMQRVLLASSLYPVPDLLLLDEPVSGVDKAGMKVFYKIVSGFRREYDLSILLISHDFTEAAMFADRMILLNGAVLCDGSPEKVLSSPEIKSVFGAVYEVGKINAVEPGSAVERKECPPEKAVSRE